MIMWTLNRKRFPHQELRVVWEWNPHYRGRVLWWLWERITPHVLLNRYGKQLIQGPDGKWHPEPR